MPADPKSAFDWRNDRELSLLIDVLSNRLHQSCDSEGLAPIGNLVNECPAEYQDCVFVRLVIEEVQLRRMRSQVPDIAQYRLRFPDKIGLVEQAWHEIQPCERTGHNPTFEPHEADEHDTQMNIGEPLSKVVTKLDPAKPQPNHPPLQAVELHKQGFVQAAETLFDSLCQKFSAELSQGIKPDLNEYVERCPCPEPLRTALVAALLKIQSQARTVRTDPPNFVESTQRFPEYATVVEDIGGPQNVDAMYASERIKPSSTLPRRFADFELTEEIGKGGMGVVYKAQDKNLGRTVAIKVIRPELLLSISNDDRLDLMSRFRNEVQAAAQLEHDHVLRIYQVGDWQGQLYYAMQFVRGNNLRDKLEHGPLQPEVAARYMAHTADALAAAHAKGILHRDVKPHNVIVEDESDRALLADFGLAKLINGDQQLTASEAILGSPPYMSPEQTVDASKVTEASDIYGLGASLYHLLTGRPPFQAATPTATMMQVQSMPPVAPRLLNSAIPRDLETICLKCLSKRETDRYASASEVRDELQRFLAGEPIHAKPPTPIQIFLRWYPKHGTTMLGAYFLVTPMTWVFYILGGSLQTNSEGGLRLSSPVFLSWACLWIGLGYMIIKRGLWFELINLPVLLAFATMPFWLDDEPQAYVLIFSISLFGIVLQVAAMFCRFSEHTTRVG